MPVLRYECSRIKVLASTLLILNIVVGIAVISLVSLRRQWCTSSSTIDKEKIDKIYDTEVKNVFRPLSYPVKASQENVTLEFLSLLKPVFHLTGLDFQKNKEASDTNQARILRNWSNTESSETVRHLLWNGMRYEKGSVSVPTNGVYHVHSHVKFYVENNRPSDPVKKFQHDIVKYNAATKEKEVVISNAVSECKEGINGGAHLEYPSDVAALVHLNAGDQISVRVTHSLLLRHDSNWHNFGVHLI